MKRTSLLIACSTLLLTLAAPPAATAAPIHNPASGHYYDVVLTPITWADASNAAVMMSIHGLPGHLLAIESQAENDFVTSTFPETTNSLQVELWIGGFQPSGSPEPGGGWRWVTGEPFTFTNWQSNEPNNHMGIEDVMHFYSDPDPGKWNDRRRDEILQGYVVEFEQPLHMSIQVSQVQICWTPQVTRMYQVEYRSELTTNMWVSLGSPVASNGSTNCVADSVLAQPRRFYRVRQLP